MKTKAIKGLGCVVGMSVLVGLLTGCSAALDEATSSSEGEIVSAKRGSITFKCKDWDASCREQVSSKLAASKAKAPRSVLRAIDQATRDPGYSAAHDNPDEPEPWHRCGSFEDNGALVSWCCDGGWFYISCTAHMDVI
ncbi:MAG: hypothetical protein U0174_17555 [Polyangiaceae bacterium]